MKTMAVSSSRGRGWRMGLVGAFLTLAVAGTMHTLSWAQTSTMAAPSSMTATHAAALVSFRQARELYQQENYADANAANEKALQIEPGLKDALLLRKVLQGKLGDTTTSTPGSGTPTAGGPAPKVKLLTAQQISMIRLGELSDSDTQIRGRVSRKFLDTFWSTYLKTQPGSDLSQGAYNAFMNPNNFANQVRAIKNSNNAEFAGNVELTSDPADMIPFRTMIQPYILQNCATAACHGGDKAGNFHLLRPGGSASDAVTYTDFYIMTQYVMKDGGKLINRDEPDKSLFLQYGVPKTVAHYAHPGKADVRPRFGDENAPEYKTMSDWVKTLAFPQPNYGIVYEIPGMTPATMPAGPTTKPAPVRTPPARTR